MKRRVADIVFATLRDCGIGHVYLLSGGGIMYLTDALGRSGIMPVCCHHEQAAAIAAQAHAMYANAPSCCLVTTGPGGTNALTGCAAAYMDSTPVLFISGQVKTADSAALRHVRQFGAQENDIVSMARPVTKYAVLVKKPGDVLYELQKALHLATHGRQGPVWVDIPLNVQCAEVEEESLRHFDAAAEHGDTPSPADLDAAVAACLDQLAHARKPLILAGHGVVAAHAQDSLRRVVHMLGIPMLATWRALEILGSDDALFFGSPGLQAVRSANIITQGADFLLVLGSRLDNMITAFSEPRFAPRAAKVIVDVDAAEIRKLAMTDVTPVTCDAGAFLSRFERRAENARLNDLRPWLAFCRRMRERYPLASEQQPHPSPLVDLYHLAAVIGEGTRDSDDALVISSTSRCNTAGHIALTRKEGQRSVSSMGFGSMGFALPSVTGVWFASGGRRVICLEGDGSFQLNLQELQTIRNHAMDAKIFVFNNNGYAAIATMQDRNFDGFHVGCDAASGVTMPSLERMAAAYGFGYTRIDNDADVETGVARALETAGPLICECAGDLRFDEIPKCISSVNSRGERVSAHLENPYPFLPPTELENLYAGLEADLS